MKTKILIVAALFGAAVMSANAGVRFGISVGFPTVVVATPPVYVAPVVVAPAPVAVCQTVQTAPVAVVETVPASPGVGYVWTPGYYSTGHVWIGGAWHSHAVQYRYDHHDRGQYRGHDGYRR
ncbi:MAG TPA: hypothetical protein VGI03_05010 [Verrucomicrobiae bacterium]|jgi:hypothetical protein